MSDVSTSDFEVTIEKLAPVLVEKLFVSNERAAELAVSLVGPLIIEPDNTVAVRELETGAVVGYVPLADIEPILF